MKAARLLRWSGNVLSPRTRPNLRYPLQYSSQPIRPRIQSRTQATAAATIDPVDDHVYTSAPPANLIPEEILTKLPSPPVQASRTSAQLAALHARLGLPSRLPLESLARTLVHPSADSNEKFNNSAFAVLGSDLLQYYTSEYIICQYPRLPLAVVFSVMNGYCGPKALATITREWGVQSAAAPGGEVDPALLQFKHMPPGESQALPNLQSNLISTQPLPDSKTGKRRHSISSRTVYDDAFGEMKKKDGKTRLEGVTTEEASSDFVRAVMGAIYLHAGRAAAKHFFNDHFMTRRLNVASLMIFRTPTKDLSKLCGREGFQPPVARILSETGRLSRHPVFIVGVFSGKEKLGEGAGGSLDEARTRAAVAALKSWYLYSPLSYRVPSDADEPDAKPWAPQHVDVGDIVT